MTGKTSPNTQRSLVRRVFSPANVISAFGGLAVFLLGVNVLNTNRGILVAGIAAGTVAGVLWYGTTKVTATPSLSDVLRDVPLLGSIPQDESGPAPALNDSDTTDRYTGLLREIEGQTTGRVLLVSSPGPGQGASSVSLNLAIAAAKSGRRVMLVDADPSPNGLGQYLSSGSSPGLSDVAQGTATLAEASRMWTLEDGTQFPMLASGEELADTGDLAGILVADALDVVSERADLILIDVPPVLWSSATPDLGAHADGTILVVSDGADPQSVSEAMVKLESAGAPVLGYVRNRSRGSATVAPHWIRSAAIRVAAVATVLLLGYGVYTAAQLYSSWQSLETQSLNQAAVEELIEGDGSAAGTTENDSAASGDDLVLDESEAPPSIPRTTAPTEAYETMLLIGSDKISGATDVILYLVRPTNGADPFMVSLPRDLYVENPCTGGNSRINTLIRGCESKGINGPTLLAHQVQAVTGIEVDHFAWFDFEGFEEVIDAIGGVEICHEYPVSDKKAELSMPAGCTQASGEQALSWVRSRHTLQNINGSWRSVPGASDLMRNQHQQDVIIELFTEMKTFASPTELTTKVASLTDVFVLDDSLSLAEAAEVAWSLKSINLADINRLEIPVRLTRSKKGQSILVITVPFDEVLAEVYGRDLPTEDVASTENATGAQ